MLDGFEECACYSRREGKGGPGADELLEKTEPEQKRPVNEGRR